jgi:hypothetical protein
VTLEGDVNLVLTPRDVARREFLEDEKTVLTRNPGQVLVLMPNDEKSLVRKTTAGTKFVGPYYHNTENTFSAPEELKIALVFREVQTFSHVDKADRQVLHSAQSLRVLDPEGVHRDRFETARKEFNLRAEAFCKHFRNTMTEFWGKTCDP